MITIEEVRAFLDQGPVIDLLNKQSEMWVFGKCISFHLAEHPMRYPFKPR